jgi:hypothetical protein
MSQPSSQKAGKTREQPKQYALPFRQPSAWQPRVQRAALCVGIRGGVFRAMQHKAHF